MPKPTARRGQRKERKARDRYREPGAIFIPSIVAPVAPLPAGTKVGNLDEMTDRGRNFHLAVVKLVDDEDPNKLRAAAQKLSRWVSEIDVDDEILDPAERERFSREADASLQDPAAITNQDPAATPGNEQD